MKPLFAQISMSSGGILVVTQMSDGGVDLIVQDQDGKTTLHSVDPDSNNRNTKAALRDLLTAIRMDQAGLEHRAPLVSPDGEPCAVCQRADSFCVHPRARCMTCRKSGLLDDLFDHRCREVTH